MAYCLCVILFVWDIAVWDYLRPSWSPLATSLVCCYHWLFNINVNGTKISLNMVIINFVSYVTWEVMSCSSIMVALMVLMVAFAAIKLFAEAGDLTRDLNRYLFQHSGLKSVSKLPVEQSTICCSLKVNNLFVFIDHIPSMLPVWK